MADGIEIRINGLEALQDKLRAFTGNAARRIYTAASRNALKETRKNVIKRAQSTLTSVKERRKMGAIDDPRTVNSIPHNVQTKVNSKQFLRNGNIYARVGIAGGATKDKGGGGKGGDTYYWRFLEFGTSKMPARPFIRPAMDAEQITTAYADTLSAAIAKEVKRMGDGA